MSYEELRSYWDQRFREDRTGWDIGAPSRPLITYIDQLRDPSLKILIPGCGYAWEGEYLHRKGFDQVYLLDVAPFAFESFRERVPDFPEEHLILEDFFQHEGTYDLILEQTFFCSFDPALRPRYAEKMAQLLRSGGTLAGVLFTFENDDGPPFGGNVEEYRAQFRPWFDLHIFEEAYNSIPPRMGNELFMVLRRR